MIDDWTHRYDLLNDQHNIITLEISTCKSKFEMERNKFEAEACARAECTLRLSEANDLSEELNSKLKELQLKCENQNSQLISSQDEVGNQKTQLSELVI